MFFSDCGGCQKKCCQRHERSPLHDISVCTSEHVSDVVPHGSPPILPPSVAIESWPRFDFAPEPFSNSGKHEQDQMESGLLLASYSNGEKHEQDEEIIEHVGDGLDYESIQSTTANKMVGTVRFDLSNSHENLKTDSDVSGPLHDSASSQGQPGFLSKTGSSSNMVNAMSMTSRMTEVTSMSNGEVVGLGITAFTDSFDRHFGVNSQKIVSVLGKEKLTKDSSGSGDSIGHEPTTKDVPRFSMFSIKGEASTRTRRSRASVAKIQEIDGCLPAWKEFFQSIKDKPPFWGVKVRFIIKFWEYICDDLLQYSSCHAYAESFKHLCLVPSCGWYHAELPSREKGVVRIRAMQPNMHLVVQRYVKPWTRHLNGAGMSLMFNAGHVSKYRQVGMEELCHASVFISHCWQDCFESFVDTLRKMFDPETVVWVCSFAIWQHGDVSGALSSLEECPFALALHSAERVIVVSDSSVDVLTRCWCILEAKLSTRWNKPYDMVLNVDGDDELWKTVENAIEQLDIERCHATDPADKVAIVDYAQHGEGGIDGVNHAVRTVVHKASGRAKLMGAAAAGSLRMLDKVDIEELRNWRDVRGQGLMHIAARHGQVRALMHLHRRVGEDQLDLLDLNSNSPLSVAAMDGSLAGVQCLIGLKASLDNSSEDGMAPLHFAAAGGHGAIVLVLLNALADVEMKGKYLSIAGRRPLHIASREGRTEIVRILIQRDAEIDALADNGLSVLFHAVTGEHVHTLATLISLQANVNLRNGDAVQKTPLLGAVAKNLPEMVSLLLESTADVHVKDADGCTCLDYLCKSSSRDAQLVKQILSRTIKRRRRCIGCRMS